MADDVLFGDFTGNADGVLDGLGFRTAMTDNKAAIDTEQRRTAVFGEIQSFLQRFQGRVDR